MIVTKSKRGQPNIWFHPDELGLDQTEKAFWFMLAYQECFGYPPTIRTVCSFLGYHSTSTGQRIISELTGKGLLRPRKPGAIHNKYLAKNSSSI